MGRWVVVTVVILTPAGGCRSTVRDCNELVESINAEGARVNAARKHLVRIQTDAAVADRLRASVDEAQATVEAIDSRDEGVESLRNEYLALLHTVRASADAFESAARATATPGSSRSALVDAALEADRALSTERDLTTRINDYCSGS